MHGGLVELKERNPVSRVFHAKSDGDAIAGWRMDLNRILHIFNVRSAVPSPHIPFTHFQTELALDTHVVALDIRQDVARTHGLVSDIHRTIVSGQEGADTGNQTVGIHNVLFIIEQLLQLPRLEPGL